MSEFARFTRTDADRYALTYVTPRDEANTPVLLTSYWQTMADAIAARDRVTAMGATNARIDSIVEIDALESGDDCTRVTFTTTDGDEATVAQPGDMLTAATAVIRAYGHLAYEAASPWGRYRTFTATDIHTGATMSYRVDRFGQIVTAADATDADEARNDDGLTFTQWRAAIDQIIGAACGMSADDFADAPYWDNWADGVTPDEMISVIGEYDEIAAAIFADIDL